MKKILFSLLFLCPLTQATEDSFSYQEEFKSLKTVPAYKVMLDEKANPSLRAIQRSIENRSELSFLQRYRCWLFLALEGFIITPENMPKLYAYIDTMCKEHGMATPYIFISTQKGFFNAMAQKLFMGIGGIIIGEELLMECSDKALEAVVAHEIGHIKYNHVNKGIALTLGTHVAGHYALKALAPKQDNLRMFFHIFLADIITSTIINKQFEKQADEFAYREMGKGEGIIQFFENALSRKAKRESDFDITYETLKNAHDKLSYLSYGSLHIGYGLAKLSHLCNKGFEWIYYNTPLGAHPSPEARIKAAREYLESETLLN